MASLKLECSTVLQLSAPATEYNHGEITAPWKCLWQNKLAPYKHNFKETLQELSKGVYIHDAWIRCEADRAHNELSLVWKKTKNRADRESASAKLNQRAKCRQRLDTVVMSNQTFYPRGCGDLEDGGTTWKNCFASTCLVGSSRLKTPKKRATWGTPCVWAHLCMYWFISACMRCKYVYMGPTELLSPGLCTP